MILIHFEREVSVGVCFICTAQTCVRSAAVLVLTLLYVRHACLMAGRLAELSVAECLAACQHCGFI